MPGVFEGFTVVELADRRNQFAGKLLSDGGARVIQVEPPAGGPGRWVGPFVDDQPDPNKCLDYWWYNTGKESLALDITRGPGQDAMRRLLAKADVFVESTRPGTLKQYGLDYDTVSKDNPGLLYMSLTDFGQDGPWVNLEMNDHAHLALGGPMAGSGYSDPHEHPMGGQRNHAYNMTNVVATHTLTAALFERMTSGLGQAIDISIHDIVSVSTESAVPNWLWYNAPYVRQTGQHAAPTYRPQQQIQCADGRYVTVSMPSFTTNAWVQLVKWMEEVGVAEDLSDPKWLDDFYRQNQLRHGHEVHDGVVRLLSKVEAQEAFIRGQSMGLAWAVVRSPEENVDFPHYKDRGFWVDIEHEDLGRTVRYPRGPYTSEDLGVKPEGRAPLLGEHTQAILAELGLEEATQTALIQTGVAR